MELYLSALAVLLIIAAMALILKNFGFKGAPVFVCVGIIFILSSYGSALFGIKETLSELASYSDVSKYTGAAMKVLGIGYLSGISADICRELGEGGVAKGISTVSKLELLALTSPFIEELLLLCTELLSAPNT